MSENQKEPQYKLRWSEELRDKVVESAKQHSRSINAEICTRLEQSFDHTTINNQDLAETIKQLNDRILELSQESREMRMLYVEALNSKLNK